ncbi:MAG: putative quinol monooxygenase [Flavobacteriales bacterium]
MIKRIVKMEFEPENVSAFVNIFKTNKDKITTFNGCHSVELLRDINAQNIFFTYSIWDSESSLNKYRESNTFKEIWSKTKPLFSNKAKAWSVEEI